MALSEDPGELEFVAVPCGDRGPGLVDLGPSSPCGATVRLDAERSVEHQGQ